MLHGLPALRRVDRFAPWFYRIVANEAKQRLRTTSRETVLETGAVDARVWTDDVAMLADRVDVRSAIDTLEPALRATIVLRYYFGMSSAAIGHILGVSPVTARWRLMLAHRRLRALLEPAVRGDFAIAPEPFR